MGTASIARLKRAAADARRRAKIAPAEEREERIKDARMLHYAAYTTAVPFTLEG